MAVYLDHAATTPVRAGALEAFLAAAAVVGNPSSLHSDGRAARRMLEESRESLADLLGVAAPDVIFTSGATEADNIGIKGIYAKAIENGRKRVLVAATEHHAVIDSVEWLRTQGADVQWLPVDSDGLVQLEALAQALAQGSVALVAVMWVNNETGAIAPIEQIAELCAEHQVPLHCDAVQGVATLMPPGEWLKGPATLAISGHKLGAPIGIGALVASGVTPQQLSHGGGQEAGIRSGTIPVAMAAALAAALRETRDDTDTRNRIGGLRDELEAGIRRLIPDARINAGETSRIGTISSVMLPGCRSDALLMLLDAAGISCSAGSACTAGVPRPSHVLLAMRMSEDEAAASLRFSLGWNSTRQDVEAALAALPAAVERARNVRATVVRR